ncbi:3D domain-containing protein [Shouchella clausii]|uniref:Cell wall-binding protein n=2 Tax=Shouchella clausii TaxID=79880 RepID=Q5WKS5_SHOC1|nr:MULTISPECIES: 3D domain-containing protein [Shouchella]ALA52382.1 Cell wall-binding protein [Shouchella clausii]MBU3230189.1 LysM peptidoglycan-binding domain-containing protein [Shouchella clausii]MBU3262612.1 LysM peptidoglycan-binding domain-containing protein [Shouchella clausii]MBU3507073.1 LysM peptidoglycan-binding domain-containing protein [Shouchella clausii]MBU3534597.1 LysM peptidoglycan-binding domain-containing protein [Shouchella clausii]
MKKLIASLAVVGSILIASPAFAYEVQSGDTLSSIANNNQVSVTALMEANPQISDKNLIFAGQELNMPGAEESNEPQLKGETETNEQAPSETESSPKEASTTLTVEATAYTASCNGCTGVTYTGIDLNANPNQKVIAVDPNVIPLGSKVYVEGYGEAIAADIGGAIKGNKIDVFIPNESEALQFGRQEVTVQVY